MNQSNQKKFLKRYGPWAVVTGASDGIGRECARQLAARGLNVVIAARRESELHQLAGELTADHDVEVRPVAADLSSGAGVARLDAVASGLDVGLLVAAAGYGTSGDFTEADLAAELNMLEVNCGAVLQLTHRFARDFARRGRGGIVLFGSLVGFQGAPRAAHYAATKAYVQTLGEALHVELAPCGVDVLVSAPGPVRSGFAARARMTLDAAETPATVARATVAALGSRMTVTPGMLSKILTWPLMTAPRSLRTRIMGKIMGGMVAGGMRPKQSPGG